MKLEQLHLRQMGWALAAVTLGSVHAGDLAFAQVGLLFVGGRVVR